MTDIAIKCTCGKVTGTVRNLSASTTNHVLCSCKSCQSYAYFLGRTADMLDDQGGSNIFQMDPKYFEIDSGHAHINCMSITPKGPLRWYTSCCNTPLGNTFPRGGIPFLGVLPICIGHKGTSDEITELVGPIRGHVNQQTPTAFGEKLGNFFMLLRFMGQLLKWRITGGKSSKPFFDPETLRPIIKPLRLNADELANLEAKAGF